MDYLSPPPDNNLPEVASVLDEMSYWFARFAAMIFGNLALQSEITALDVGFGSGCPLLELAQMHVSSSRFVGLDVWNAGMIRAREKQHVFSLSNVEILLYDGHSFPFPDEHFDLIVSNLGLDNFDEPSVVLSECARWPSQTRESH